MLTLPPLFLVFPPWHGWKNKNSSPLPLIHCSPTKSLGNVSLDRSSPTTTRVSTKYFSIIFLFSPLKAINQNLSTKFDRPPSSMRFDEWASKLNYVYFWSFFLFLIKRRINYTIDRFNVKVRARIKSSKLKYRFFLQKNRRIQTETELQVTKLRVYIIWSNQSDMIKEPCWWEKEETLSPSSPPRCL